MHRWRRSTQLGERLLLWSVGPASHAAVRELRYPSKQMPRPARVYAGPQERMPPPSRGHGEGAAREAFLGRYASQTSSRARKMRNAVQRGLS